MKCVAKALTNRTFACFGEACTTGCSVSGNCAERGARRHTGANVASMLARAQTGDLGLDRIGSFS